MAEQAAAPGRAEARRTERLLRVATCLAEGGHGQQAAQLAATARALRGDAQLWAALARHRGPRGRTHLMHVGCVGSAARAQFMLEAGADVEAAEHEFGLTALIYACSIGKLEVARLLVGGWRADANAAAANGSTPLMWALTFGRLDVARYLLEAGGANVEAAAEGVTALMAACGGGKLEAARFLVEHGGADVNAACAAEGVTALMLAAQARQLEVVRYLLGRGARLEDASSDGRTALMWAIQDGNAEVLCCLLERGASVQAWGGDGGFAAQKSAILGKDLEVMRVLVERGGADVNAASEGGLTVLMWSTLLADDKLRFTRYLVERGANVNAHTADGVSALRLACYRAPADALESARCLIERGGADVNAASAVDGKTVLMTAARRGHLETVRLLLQHGADRAAVCHAGRTAHDFAADYPLVQALLA